MIDLNKIPKYIRGELKFDPTYVFVLEPDDSDETRYISMANCEKFSVIIWNMFEYWVKAYARNPEEFAPKPLQFKEEEIAALPDHFKKQAEQELVRYKEKLKTFNSVQREWNAVQKALQEHDVTAAFLLMFYEAYHGYKHNFRIIQLEH